MRRREQDMGWLFCEAPNVPASGPLYFWSYAYYLSKYIELGDTVLQALVHPPSRRVARSRHVASHESHVLFTRRLRARSC